MNLIPLLYDIPFRFYHQMKQAMSTETRPFWRQISIFLNYFNCRSLYIKICPSANTDHRIAFCYFLESFAQCASNESSFIALRHSIQVLPSDETGHVYRNEVISASKPAIFIATKISKVIHKNLFLCKY